MQLSVSETPRRRSALFTLRTENLVPTIILIILGILVVAPLAVLLYGSLTSSSPAGGLTFQNYIRAYTRAAYFNALKNSLVVSGMATIIAELFGVSLAWILTSTDVPFKRALNNLVLIPFFLSPFIGGLAWSMLLAPNVGLLTRFLETTLGFAPSIYSPYGIAWVMGLYFTPVVYLFTSSALRQIDASHEEAALMVGMSPSQVVRRITLPLVRPALLSALLITFVSSMGQFGVPALLGVPVRYYVLTTRIFDLTHNYPANYSLAAAVATMLLIICMFAVYVQKRVLTRGSYATLSGKGIRSRTVKLGPWRYPVFLFAAAFVLFAVILPILAIFYRSLLPVFVGEYSLANLTLDNYRRVIQFPLTMSAIRNSLVLSSVAGLAVVLLGTIIGWVVYRSKNRVSALLEYIAMLPASVPYVVLAVGILWMWIFLPLPVYGTPWLLLIGYVGAFIPYGLRSALASFAQMDPGLEEAGTMIGMSWRQRLRYIVLPIMKPSLFAAWILVFVILIREISISIFLYSPGTEVLPVMIFNLWAEGVHDVLGALSTIQVALVLGIILLIRGFGIDLRKNL